MAMASLPPNERLPTTLPFGAVPSNNSRYVVCGPKSPSPPPPFLRWDVTLGMAGPSSPARALARSLVCRKRKRESIRRGCEKDDLLPTAKDVSQLGNSICDYHKRRTQAKARAKANEREGREAPQTASVMPSNNNSCVGISTHRTAPAVPHHTPRQPTSVQRSLASIHLYVIIQQQQQQYNSNTQQHQHQQQQQPKWVINRKQSSTLHPERF
ncbi:hypothetical protein IWZ00DRAFT_239108 [Phyllosticta capitalensis]|uniref:uncharacterized protein n=1 Tax=Phyllosticta capitalensis TaxID=121624 RepID=UPI00312D84B8